MLRSCMAITRLLGLLGLVVFVTLTHAVFAIFGKNWSFSRRLYGMIARLFGLKVRCTGVPHENAEIPTIYVANHISYLDIIILGSLLNGLFIAKSEVADWPIFGAMAKIQNSVFIKRSRSAIDAFKNVVADLLKSKKSVILFAEGTSTDGTTVKPFKPGLLEAAYTEGVEAIVQPVAIVLETIEGQSAGINETLRDTYAWWRPETTLAPHLWGVGRTRQMEIAIHFLPPIKPSDYPDRKALGQAVHEAIRQVVEAGARLG